MDTYLVILAAVVGLSLVWNTFAVPWLGTRGVNPALLGTVTLVVGKAVRFAEQMYKVDKDTDRKALAHFQIDEMLNELGINPVPWSSQIDWLIEAAVNELPRTNET